VDHHHPVVVTLRGLGIGVDAVDAARLDPEPRGIQQVSTYDARFVACARRLPVPLVTEDSRLRAATPGSSMSIAEAVSRSAG